MLSHKSGHCKHKHTSVRKEYEKWLKDMLKCLPVPVPRITPPAPVITPNSSGQNTNGQLGDGTTDDTFIVVDVVGTPTITEAPIIAMSSRSGTVMSLNTLGKVSAWGDNLYGQAGIGPGPTGPQILVPTPIDMTGPLFGKFILRIACGDSASMVLADDGGLYTVGDNSTGLLGRPGGSSLLFTPVDMTGVLAGKSIVEIDCCVTALVLDSNGAVYTWGSNNFGALGNNSGVGSSNVPVAVDTSGVLAGKVIKKVSTGYFCSIVLDSNGAAYTWGGNFTGQLGDGTNTDSSVPVAVYTGGDIDGEPLVEVMTCTTSNFFMFAIDDLGNLYSWGGNGFGQLGNGTLAPTNVPLLVDYSGVLAGKRITRITAGTNYALALDTDGNIYGWGSDDVGQMANGSITVTIPSPIIAYTTLNKPIAQVVASRRFSVVIPR
jgi:alpha-tubulin suppressor-like RCC1 family protein